MTWAHLYWNAVVYGSRALTKVDASIGEQVLLVVCTGDA